MTRTFPFCLLLSTLLHAGLLVGIPAPRPAPLPQRAQVVPVRVVYVTPTPQPPEGTQPLWSPLPQNEDTPSLPSPPPAAKGKGTKGPVDRERADEGKARPAVMRDAQPAPSISPPRRSEPSLPSPAKQPPPRPTPPPPDERLARATLSRSPSATVKPSAPEPTSPLEPALVPERTWGPSPLITAPSSVSDVSSPVPSEPSLPSSSKQTAPHLTPSLPLPSATSPRRRRPLLGRTAVPSVRLPSTGLPEFQGEPTNTGVSEPASRPTVGPAGLRTTRPTPAVPGASASTPGFPSAAGTPSAGVSPYLSHSSTSRTPSGGLPVAGPLQPRRRSIAPLGRGPGGGPANPRRPASSAASSSERPETEGEAKPDKEETGYTGLIVDARGLGPVKRAMSPALITERGEVIYGRGSGIYPTPDRVIEPGLVRYARGTYDPQDPVVSAPNGQAQPLVVRALAVKGWDLIISSQDGERIRQENQRNHFLQKCRVIFVTD